MKVRFCIGIAVMIVLLMVGISSARTSQVNAANVLVDGPGEAWVTEYVSTSPDAGYHVSIAIDEDDSNTPWVAYYNKTDGSLMVAHFVGVGNGDCSANDAWKCEQVDYEAGGSKGLYTSIDVHPDTNPSPFLSTWEVGVSYYDAGYKTLKYASYSCPLIGECEWSVGTVDGSSGADSVGQYTSLKIGSDGTPQISYYMYDDEGDFRLEKLKYAYFVGSGEGNCGDYNNWECTIIDYASALSGQTNFGAYSSLDLDNEGRVYISFYDGVNGDLKIAYYQGFGGACMNTAWHCVVIDDGDGDDEGLFSSLHALNDTDDMMSIAYYNKTAGLLMYAYDTTGTGNCAPSNTWQCMVMEDVGADLTQMSISLAVSDTNVPMIAYSDDEMSQTMILRVASPAPFESYANCGGEILYSWWCRTVDGANWDLEDAEYAAMAIKSNGKAVIAYSENDSRYGKAEMHLKVTYQGFESMLPLVAK